MIWTKELPLWVGFHGVTDKLPDGRPMATIQLWPSPSDQRKKWKLVTPWHYKEVNFNAHNTAAAKLAAEKIILEQVQKFLEATK